jgi:hypothetical protein
VRFFGASVPRDGQPRETRNWVGKGYPRALKSGCSG